jgi:alpha-ribazole phosphatase
MRLYLVRHPPAAVAEGVCYGRSDLALAAGWESVLEASLARVPSEDRSRAWLYASPARRCREPAERIGGEVRLDPRLLELDFGDWELRSWAEIPHAEVDAWVQDVAGGGAPGGERLVDLADRASAWLAEVEAQAPRVALAVTHGGVIRCLLARALDMPLAGAMRLRVDHGGVSRISSRSGLRAVDFVNR